MKQIITVLVTLIVLLGVNWGASSLANVLFIDLAFVAGLLISVLIWFFTSKGGVTTELTDGMMQTETTNWKMKKEKHIFKAGLAFYVALAYTLVSLVATFIYYRVGLCCSSSFF